MKGQERRPFLLLAALVQHVLCTFQVYEELTQVKPNPTRFTSSDEKEILRSLDTFNREFEAIRHMEADAAWNVSIKITPANQEILQRIQQLKETWRAHWCKKVPSFRSQALLPEAVQRQLWLMCRGPIYTPELSREFESTQQELYRLYHTTVVCYDRPSPQPGPPCEPGKVCDRRKHRSNRALFCEHGEPELTQRMKTERDPKVLLSIWRGWHDSVGTPRGKELYRSMVGIMNEAARANGYRDVSETWKEQLSVPKVEKEAEELFSQIFPFYQMLHGYVRHRLNLFYGDQVLSQSGKMPAHLLGNMWGQSWSSLMDIVAPKSLGNFVSLTSQIRESNMTVMDLVKSAEKLYLSMGFEPMTEQFWRHSQFVKPWEQMEETSCHPSALDMYSKGDYRIEMCGEEDEEAFLTAHHEMGHIQYYMNYADLPPILRDGANPAFHEAVGDSMVYAAQSPKHLQRLGLASRNEDVILHLLHQALDRIPLIAWSLVVDKWRWDVFSGKIGFARYNRHWWNLREKLQGVEAPVERSEENFDPLAKFHIPDNSPYMPYFFSSFLQVQMLDGMCKSTLRTDDALETCDLFNNKSAGRKMRKMMSLGQSRPWQEAIFIMTGEKKFSAQPLLNYYAPLIKWLKAEIETKDITIGW